MKYIVEVGEPIPSDLDEVAGKVAASFNISDAKAMALLRRAPGAMTKAVSEREADVVAGIFERAGLNVVKRPVAAEGDEGAADATAGAAPAGGSAQGGEPAGAPPPVRGDGGVPPGRAPVTDDAGEQAAHEPPAGAEDDVWNQPLGATEGEPVDRFSRRDEFEQQAADIGWQENEWDAPAEWDGAAERGADVAAAPTPDVGVQQPPEDGGGSVAAEEFDDEAIDVETGTPAGERSAGSIAAEDASEPGAGEAPTPDRGRRRRKPERPQRAAASRAPREAGGRSAERGGDEVRLRRGGLRRGIAWIGILPALLCLLGMGVAVLVTLVPVARDQQAAQAADAAASQAAALQALTGGLPLTAQTLRGALTDLSNNSQTLLRPHDVSLMVVTDPSGGALAGWYGVARTPAAMPPATRRAVSASALAAVGGQPEAPAPTFTENLRSTWTSVKAMLGQSSEGTVLRAVPVMSAGQAIGAVVVGVPPVSGQSTLLAAFETVFLVGVIPLLIGILMALGLTGGLRRKVQYLLQAADRISRGDLDEQVSLRSRDELGQLARAIERMRVSLSTLLEHRRRHR